MARYKSDNSFDFCDQSVVLYSALYQTYYLDEKLSPDLSLSISIQGHATAACLPVACSRMSRQGKGRSVSRQVIASPVVHGWLMFWAERIVVVVVLYEYGGSRGIPHIDFHHAFLQHVQAKAVAVKVVPQPLRKVLG